MAFQFLDFPNSSLFILSDQCALSWRGGRSGITNLVNKRYMKCHWLQEWTPKWFICLHWRWVRCMLFSNEVFVVTRFNKAKYQRVPPRSVVFKPRLKEFLEICVLQFHEYIWSTTEWHNIYNYLDQVWHETQIFINPSNCLIKSFACKIRISCWINLPSQFSIRTLMFSFLFILSHLQHLTCRQYLI